DFKMRYPIHICFLSPRFYRSARSYSSCRRHQTPVSLRPLGARSSHWYMPHKCVQSARIGGIGVVNDTVFECQRAHAWPLANIRRWIGSAHRRESSSAFAGAFPWLLEFVIVFEATLALLLLGEPNVEVGVKITAERRRPRKRPAHSPFVRLKLGETRSRHRPKHDVVIRQVNHKSVEAVRDGRAGWTACCVIRSEHEVVNEKLRTPAEKI